MGPFGVLQSLLQSPLCITYFNTNQGGNASQNATHYPCVEAVVALATQFSEVTVGGYN
jgi:hypothetical protein